MSIDSLMAGAVDMHCHCYPELSLGYHARHDNLALLRSLNEAGMGGVVLKSHFWPTVSQAYYLDRESPSCRVFGSITLNNASGGISPLSVEAAALQGAKVVYFPTWSADSDRSKGMFWTRIAEIFPKYAADDQAITILDAAGKVRANAIEVLEVAKKYDLTVFTGHLCVAEIRVLVQEAVGRGVKIVFSHPNYGAIAATPEETLAVAQLGAWVEFCCVTMISLRARANIFELVALIRQIGVEKVVLTTDAFNDWVPPAAEMMRMFIGMMLRAGLDEQAVRQMVYHNPRRLLGMTLEGKDNAGDSCGVK